MREGALDGHGCCTIGRASLLAPVACDLKPQTTYFTNNVHKHILGKPCVPRETCLSMGTGSAFNCQNLQNILESMRNRIQCLCSRIQHLCNSMQCPWTIRIQCHYSACAAGYSACAPNTYVWAPEVSACAPNTMCVEQNSMPVQQNTLPAQQDTEYSACVAKCSACAPNIVSGYQNEMGLRV
jgi:hypothetical protein